MDMRDLVKHLEERNIRILGFTMSKRTWDEIASAVPLREVPADERFPFDSFGGYRIHVNDLVPYGMAVPIVDPTLEWWPIPVQVLDVQKDETIGWYSRGE